MHCSSLLLALGLILATLQLAACVPWPPAGMVCVDADGTPTLSGSQLNDLFLFPPEALPRPPKSSAAHTALMARVARFFPLSSPVEVKVAGESNIVVPRVTLQALETPAARWTVEMQATDRDERHFQFREQLTGPLWKFPIGLPAANCQIQELRRRTTDALAKSYWTGLLHGRLAHSALDHLAPDHSIRHAIRHSTVGPELQRTPVDIPSVSARVTGSAPGLLSFVRIAQPRERVPAAVSFVPAMCRRVEEAADLPCDAHVLVFRPSQPLPANTRQVVANYDAPTAPAPPAPAPAPVPGAPAPPAAAAAAIAPVPLPNPFTYPAA